MTDVLTAEQVREAQEAGERYDAELVPVTRRDLRAAMFAVERWADEAAPNGSDGYLRGVHARLAEALDREPGGA